MAKPGHITLWQERDGTIICEHHGDTSRILVSGQLMRTLGEWLEFDGDRYRVVEGPLIDEDGCYYDQYIAERVK